MQPGDRIRIHNQFLTTNSDFAENAWTFICVNTESGDDLVAATSLRDAFESLWETYLNGHVHGNINGHKLLFWKALNGQSDFLPMTELSWSLNLSSTDQPLALQTAALVRFGVTNGRRAAGKYIYGMREDSQNMSRLNSNSMAALVQWGVHVADGLTTSDGFYRPCLEDIDAGSDIFDGTVLVREITSTQRRRKPGVGA